MGPNILACTLTYLVIELGIFPIVYDEDINATLILKKVFNCMFCFLILTCIGMLVTYITRTRKKMSSLIQENFNLFDKMHEGVIVLDRVDESLKFISRPALRLLK